MVNLNNLVKKLIKKLSINENSICVIEKREDAFYHLAITEELCSLLQVNPDLIEGKEISEILSPLQTKIISKYYVKAWGGKEVFYKLDFPHGSKETLYKVLSPIILNGEVVRLISHVVTINQIPESLRNIA
ncbi:MAG: hypothetical protein ACQET8_22980 [Bacillota bacterium]